jgi:hypothetical protein
MATIGSLVVDLILKSATFNADMARSARVVEANTTRMQRSIAGIEGGLTRAGNALKAFGAATALSATARALVAVARNAINVGDEIGEAASKLGIGTQELQRLRFAAEQTDVDVTALNNAFKQFQKTIATGKAPFTTFDAIIAKIAEADTQTEKVALGFQYFGKQYQAALLIAANGAEAFKKSMDGAFTISERGIQIASDLDNQLRAISNAVQAGFNDGFLLSFNEKLGLTGDELTEINRISKEIGATVGTAFQQAAAAVQSFLSGLQQVNAFLKPISDFLNRISGAGTGGGHPLDFLRPVSQSNRPLPLGAPSFGGEEDIAKARDAAAEQAAAEAAAAEKIAGAKTAAANAQKALNEQQQLYKTLLEGSRTPQEQYAAQLALITKAHADGELGARLNTMATAQLANEYLGLASTAVGALGTLFKDSKAVAVAQAVINTAQAITATLAQYGATPWGLAASAVAAASGAAQIATIMSAQPGTGKKPSAGGSATSKPAKESKGGGGGGTMKQAVSINLMGSGGFTRDQVRQLAEQLNGLVSDGATISVS